MTWSSSPRTHTTGNACLMSPKALVLQWLGANALLTPFLPGAMPGQFCEAVVSPGYQSSPTLVRRTSSSSASSSGALYLGDQKKLDMVARTEDVGSSLDLSPSFMRRRNSGFTAPPPHPAKSSVVGVPSASRVAPNPYGDIGATRVTLAMSSACRIA